MYTVYIYVITKLYDVIICCYGDFVYHKYGSISSKTIAGVEKIAVKISDCNIFYWKLANRNIWNIQ